MFKTHVSERTQQLQTIIFLSHHEAVKCAEKNRSVRLHPLCSPPPPPPPSFIPTT